MSRARRCVSPLVAAWFALASSGVLTGQSLTRAPLATVSIAASPGLLHASPPAQSLIASAAALQPPSRSEDDAPWAFFMKNVKHADSVGKWLALIAFTMMMTYFYFPHLLNGVVIGVGVLALVRPQVRHSSLVRSGFAIFVLGFAALVVAGRFNDNPVGVGFLFALTRPLGAVMMALGAIPALLKRSDPLDRDIAALVASATSSRAVWPDAPPLPEVDRVATYGSRAGFALVELLGTELDAPSSTTAGNVHVEQQAALALCKIYRVAATAGETVRDARSAPEDKSQVNGFWRWKVGATKDPTI